MTNDFREPTLYRFDNGRKMQREFKTLTPNGNEFNGRWVLRDAQGTFVDFDKYRSDLAERNDLNLDTATKIFED